jgi:hypothetical protein
MSDFDDGTLKYDWSTNTATDPVTGKKFKLPDARVDEYGRPHPPGGLHQLDQWRLDRQRAREKALRNLMKDRDQTSDLQNLPGTKPTWNEEE